MSEHTSNGGELEQGTSEPLPNLNPAESGEQAPNLEPAPAEPKAPKGKGKKKGKGKSAKPSSATKGKGKGKKPAKAPKAPAEKNPFGSRLGTSTAAYDAVLGSKPQSMKALMAACESTQPFFNHTKALIAAGWVEKVEEGSNSFFKLSAKGAAAMRTWKRRGGAKGSSGESTGEPQSEPVGTTEQGNAA
jgi:hypothetical protein